MRRHLIALALVTLGVPTAGAEEPNTASAPAEPKQTRRRNDTAIWIGLGATFIGCAVAIGSTMVAAKTKKPAKAPLD